MGKIYEWSVNPFQDFLLASIGYNVDISNKDVKRDINTSFVHILKNILDDEKDVVYLDFDIKRKDGHFKLIGNNAISALWLSGIIPLNTKDVLKINRFIINDKQYTYNPKTKRLTYKIIKN